MARGDLNTQQKHNQRGTSASDRDIENTIIRVLENRLGIDQRMVQELQVLAGLRDANSDSGKKAVRRDDLAVLARLPELTSKEVSSVTIEDFNALRLDLRRIAEALGHIAGALK